VGPQNSLFRGRLGGAKPWRPEIEADDFCGTTTRALMLMGMIVGLELLLEIPYFLLELLDLVFESLDPLFGIGVLVPSCLLSHESSLDFGYITPHALANLHLDYPGGGQSAKPFPRK
jgi:hypothetical protein